MYYLDLMKLLSVETDSKVAYDILTLIVSFQGLVNRSGCNLYLNFIDKVEDKEMAVDRYWLNKFTAEGGFLQNEQIKTVDSLDELVRIFGDSVNGIVLWDETVPATSNVAATICGIEGLLPIRFDTTPGSFYTRFNLAYPHFSVKRNLTGMFKGEGIIPDSNRVSTGSAKCDAYIWAKEQYMDNGLCNPELMGYFLDAYPWNLKGVMYPDLQNTMVCNHDYYISKKAFFFDLTPWGDEVPNDDKQQKIGTDLMVLKEILMSQYKLSGGDKIITIGGFIPWFVKYTAESMEQCSHGAVETEWQYAEIISCYNGIMDADAYGVSGLANASVYMHHPLQEIYSQARPGEKELEQKTYIMFYMGDYDSACWLSNFIPRLWDDPMRGNIPLAWAFNPNLSDRVPHVFDYVYHSKTENDFFISGDSGAGYLNPLYLLEPREHSGLPQGIEPWILHNKKYYEKFDISITGFVINGDKPINEEVQKAYATFSKDGVGTQEFHTGKYTVDDVIFHEYFHSIHCSETLESAAEIIYQAISGKTPEFHLIRCVLTTPSFMVQLAEKIKLERPELSIEVVDSYNFFRLKKKYLARQ